MRFVDETELMLQSGNGGRGCVAFRREKFIAKGGPNGGDGGDGGSIILVGDSSMGSLLDFKHKKHIKAKNGESGMGSDKTGKGGEDIIVRLPLGTLVYNVQTGELMADIVEERKKLVLLKGGLGGKGNARFSTSTNRAPTYAQAGLPGIERKVRLELKLMADVGLLGFPNAGKSTLISRISAARPKIADYPFTTLVPNLGVVRWGEEGTFVVADIPGLIEGASQGAGLGIKFLKHVERTRLLLHLLDMSEERDPLERYLAIRGELEAFDTEVAARPEMVVLAKTDVVQTEGLLEETAEIFRKMGKEVHCISAVTGEGLQELVNATGRMIARI